MKIIDFIGRALVPRTAGDGKDGGEAEPAAELAFPAPHPRDNIIYIMRNYPEGLGHAYTLRMAISWLLRRGELISPDGWSFRPAEVATIAFRNQKIRFLKDDLERLTADHRQLQALIPAWIEYFQQHGVAAPPALQIELQKLLPRDSS